MKRASSCKPIAGEIAIVTTVVSDPVIVDGRVYGLPVEINGPKKPFDRNLIADSFVDRTATSSHMKTSMSVTGLIPLRSQSDCLSDRCCMMKDLMADYLVG